MRSSAMCYAVVIAVLLVFYSCFGYSISKSIDADEEYAAMPSKFRMDEFENCMLWSSYDAPYCMITLKLMLVDSSNVGQVWQTIRHYSTASTNYRHDLLQHGVCIPNYVKNVEKMPAIKAAVEDVYRLKYQHVGLNGSIADINCIPKEQQKRIDYMDIFFALIMCSYMGVVIYSSLLDIGVRANTKQGCQNIMECFSIQRNWKRLSFVSGKGDASVSLRCIQGIRFYNMLCVILVHTIMYHISMPSVNTRFMETVEEMLLHKLFANTGFAILTNFMISIWLLTLKILTDYKGTLNWNDLFSIICYRYIRLLPGLVAAIGFQMTWFRFTAAGPLWPPIIEKPWNNCRSNGWSNFLFINNVYKPGQMCLVQTWSLAVDVQLFLLALIFFKMLHTFKVQLIRGLLALCIAQNALLWLYFFVNNYESIVRVTPEEVLNMNIFGDDRAVGAYISLIGNSSGLIAGLIFGYLHYRCIRKEINIFWGLPLLRWGMIVLGSLGNVMIGGLIVFNKGYKHNIWFAATYGTLGRTAFVFSIGFLIFSVAHAHGGILKRFLEWTPTVFLGRLSYAVFLIHMFVLQSKFGNLRQPLYLSIWNIIYDTMATISLSYLFALPFALLFELPVTAILHRRRRKENLKSE